MTLTDPRDALAEQSNFIGYLMGLASLARVVRGLAEGDGSGNEIHCESEEFVYLLLGFVAVGDGIERLGESPAAPAATVPAREPTPRWLR
jgi:hypothetical protein